MARPRAGVGRYDAIGARLRQARERLGMSQEEFAASLGLKRPGLAMVEAGHRRPAPEALALLEKIHGIQPAQIMFGSDVVPLAAAEPADRYSTGRVPGAPTYVLTEADVVPLFRCAAGEPIEAPTDAGDTHWVPTYLKEKGASYAMRVVGDSMINAGILDGDIVFVRRVPSGRTRRRKNIVVRRRSTNETTLKHVYIKGEDVELRPDNPAHKVQVWPAKDVIVEGIVVGLVRPAWMKDED